VYALRKQHVFHIVSVLREDCSIRKMRNKEKQEKVFLLPFLVSVKKGVGYVS